MKTVIIAAGFGSRLWPLSTSDKPKQFQRLINDESLLKYTYDLMLKVTPANDLYVLTLSGLEQHVFDELIGINKSKVLLVPERRNTLPHTLWAIIEISGENPDEPILFKSADQYVSDPEVFIASMRSYIERVNVQRPLNNLVLACMESGYDPNLGYAVVTREGKIAKFVEKPSEYEYKHLIKSGALYSSPFIYACSKNVLASIFNQLHTQLAKQALNLLQSPVADRKEAFLSMPVIDISTGMFQAAIDMRAEIVDSEFIDIGRFATLYELGKKDSYGNVTQGNVVLGEGCRENFIINQLEQPLVVNQSRGNVIIQTISGSVVAPIGKIDSVGEIYKTRIHPNEKI